MPTQHPLFFPFNISKILQHPLNPLKERIRHIAEGEVKKRRSGDYRTIVREHLK